MRKGFAHKRIGDFHLPHILGWDRTQVNEAELFLSNQNRNVPFLTKLEMAPFCLLRLLSPCFFCFRGFFLKKFRVQRL